MCCYKDACYSHCKTSQCNGGTFFPRANGERDCVSVCETTTCGEAIVPDDHLKVSVMTNLVCNTLSADSLYCCVHTALMFIVTDTIHTHRDVFSAITREVTTVRRQLVMALDSLVLM